MLQADCVPDLKLHEVMLHQTHMHQTHRPAVTSSSAVKARSSRNIWVRFMAQPSILWLSNLVPPDHLLDEVHHRQNSQTSFPLEAAETLTTL